MKELVLDPFVFLPLMAVSIVYFVFLVQLSTRKKFNIVTERWVVILLIFIVSDVNLLPIAYIHPGALAGHDKSVTSAIIQSLIYAFIIIVLLRLRFKALIQGLASIFIRDPFIGALLLLAVLSAIWSETPYIALRASLVLVGFSIFAAYIANRYDWEILSNSLRWSSTLIAVLSPAVALLMPSIGISPKGWTGITSHPTVLGPLMALNATLWISYGLRQAKHRLAAFMISMISLVVMLFANSVTAYFLFFVLFSLTLWLKFIRRLSFKWAVVSFIFFLVIAILGNIFISGSAGEILDAFGKDSSLTGRTDFWPNVIEHIKQRPLLGHGIKSFWQPWRGSSDPAFDIVLPNGYRPPIAHQGFLELGLELGVIGLTLFSISFLMNSIRAVRYAVFSGSADSGLPLTLLVFMALYNFSGSALVDIKYLWFSYVFLTIRLNARSSGSV